MARLNVTFSLNGDPNELREIRRQLLNKQNNPVKELCFEPETDSLEVGEVEAA